MEETDSRMLTDEQPVRLEIERPEEHARFLLQSKAEILAVLRSLVQRRALVSAYFDQGRSFFLTSVVELDATRIVIDSGRDEAINRAVLLAEQLFLVSTLDKVKIQFRLERLSETSSVGLPAFAAALPNQLLRLQRREYFRLTTPVTKPVRLVATLRRADGSAVPVDTSILDISGGGVGLMATPSLATLLPRGQRLADGRISLPDEGLLIANLLVCNKGEEATRGGARYFRVGCEFVGLTGARMNMLQRYITRIERERKARLSGMA
ncbi:MAG: Cyclic di-GMP binding protein YcgR [Candidatus Accumulibacter sp. BA-94]|uniref:flagellar brake protein n=1 Tax=Accumulibacter sp. TaxID=2053492 RepID=UPI00044E8DD4|nr:flagellar brake protein [Accumulibacter sp.]EXI86814.1 MAG: Cyclic di-GMP binding protein YcgR [Candidatus Accumulibacter sp. BA-94]HRD91177.1 flagellar brake protein [Accumulibacter sp.]